jgi:DnaJ-class molecular chaperone
MWVQNPPHYLMNKTICSKEVKLAAIEASQGFITQMREWMACPRCKGTGKYTSAFKDYSLPGSPTVGLLTLTCIRCEGTGLYQEQK